MTTIAYADLDGHLAASGPRRADPLYLVYGEEMLCQKAVQAIVSHIFGPASGSHQIERIEGGAPGAMAEALARVNTYSLLGDAKVVLLSEARIFEDALDTRAFLEKARLCLEKNEPAEARRALMAVLRVQRLSVEEVDADTRRRLLTAAELDAADDAWLETLLEDCRGQDAGPASAEDQATLLARALERGFPAAHHLILTAAAADRRRKIFKSIEAAGTVVDASVPVGSRRADLDTQHRLLQDQMRRILHPAGKRLGTEAFQALVEMTGFDLRTFCAGLEKLVDYTGTRPEITADDIRRVLTRSKKDPIFALTGAVGERRLDQALFYLNSLLGSGSHPLQALAALTNFVRRLILARGFIDAPQGRCWRRQMDYNTFQRQVLPALLDHDRRISELVQSWRTEPKNGKRQAKTDTDLVLVKNPKSVYPVFQLLNQADRFAAAHLEAVHKRLCEADRSLKSSGVPARPVIESLLWFICHGDDPRGKKP